MKDHYSNLEINRNSSTSVEIKKSYRQLILKWHPDKNSNSEDAKNIFQEVQDAYETLGDNGEKSIYDSSFLMLIDNIEHLKNIEKDILKDKLFEKRRELNDLKNAVSVNLNGEKRFILNNRLFSSLERKLNRTDWKKFYESNIKSLEEQIKKEDLEKILKVMKEIIEMEKNLIIFIKNQESQYQSLQEQKEY